MNVQILLEDFHKTGSLSEEVIYIIQNDQTLRVELIQHFRQHQNRHFALYLLNTFITVRRDPEGIMPFEDLMFACYLLGLHQQVEDCLKIWEVKRIDFDTYCGLDIQLVPFAGVNKTLAFLKEQTTVEGEEAYEHIKACFKAGDFDTQDEYYSKETLPWYI